MLIWDLDEVFYPAYDIMELCPLAIGSLVVRMLKHENSVGGKHRIILNATAGMKLHRLVG